MSDFIDRHQNKKTMKKLILNLCALCVLCGQIQSATVEAEGRVPGDMKTAREHSDFSK